MGAVDEKRAAPARELFFEGVDGFIGIDVEAIGGLDFLGEEVGADEADAAVQLQVAGCALCPGYELRIGFDADGVGKNACQTGNGAVSASEVREEPEPGKVYLLEKIEQVSRAGGGPGAGGGQAIGQLAAIAGGVAVELPVIGDELSRFTGSGIASG